MRKALVILLGVCFLTMFIGSVSAREVNNAGKRVYRDWTEEEYPQILDPGAHQFTAAAADTYCLVWYDFESGVWQGWTRVDQTAQVDTFSHVDDFAGLGGGDFGGMQALEGDQSLWCGARPAMDTYMCSWETAPGYGNDWNQTLQCDAFSFTGGITFSYKGFFSSESDYDFTYVEYDAGEGSWQEIDHYDDTVIDTVAVHELFLSQAATKLRFHFTADGAWSDQDGLLNSDGAFVVDSLTINDLTGLKNYEDFEVASGAAIGDHGNGWWNGGVEAPFGSFAGLYNNLTDKDPCGDNFATQVVFFVGSPYPSSSYPGLFDTPFCLGAGGISAPCQTELIISPVIDMTVYSSNCDENQDTAIPPADLATMGGALLRFTCYRDIPLANLIFYTWQVRSIDEFDCPGQWRDRNYVYYGPDMDYIYTTQDVSDLITEDRVEIGMGCVDMCDVWYLTNGNCAEHTPSPWLDNIRFYAYSVLGPQWSHRDLDIFQDNFPSSEFTIESVVRADMAQDPDAYEVLPVEITPGDSAVINCSAPLAGGLAIEGNGEPAVFCHVLVTHMGPDAKTPPSGAIIEGDWGTYWGMDGSWTVIQMDTAYTSSGNPAPDRFCVDMNDSLFTRGFRIDYYFKARDLDGNWSTLPSRAETHPERTFEFTCLPTLASDILYVDDMHGRPLAGIKGSVEFYMDPAFRAVLPPENYPDRYDVNNPSSLVANGLGSRAKNYQLTTAYTKMIWDSGNLENGTIATGDVETSGKSPDCPAVVDWLNLSPHKVGLWVMGDDVAFDLNGQASACALDLMSNWCGVTLVHNSYYELTGGRTAGGTVTPLVHTVTGVPNVNPLHPDSFYVDGGCAVINAFDVLGNTENSQYALAYPPFLATPYYAGIQNELVNAAAFPVKTMWFGFSFQNIRDASITPGVAMVRNRIMEAVIEWMGNTVNDNVTEAETPTPYKLAQNFPNPFNPSTTVMFDMRAKGHVSLKIYNVAGQLVRTLVNSVKDAGHHKLTWDGRNNSGVAVASGVYFYKMETKDFSQTKKMIMLR